MGLSLLPGALLVIDALGAGFRRHRGPLHKAALGEAADHPPQARGPVPQGAGFSTGLAGAGGAQERLAVGRSGGRCDPRWGAGLPEPGEWDADAVRDDLQAYVVQHLGDADGVAILDG